jgi:peptidoglycan hydrolase-like protein with peptidoglycan-binding domain
VEPPDHSVLPADSDAGADAAEQSRAERLAKHRKGWRRRSLLIALIVAAVMGGGVAAYAVATGKDSPSVGASGTGLVAAAPTTPEPTTTTLAPTTTTTIPAVIQPKDVQMPSPGEGGIGWGDRGPLVTLYEARMKALHFDPGPVDGVFDQDTQYAVVAVEKYAGLTRDGTIGPSVQWTLSHFRYKPAKPKAEGDRVEIDLDRQIVTVFKHWQPILVSTASTGSGERFCGGLDGCQYAITPAGHYHFYDLHRGWQKGKLGTMWNPYYFNGSIAVHGLASVPAYPASHGCTRIPIHIADYFYTLVSNGESVYVVGTPKKAGNGYTGPVRTAPTTATTTPPTTVKAKRTTTTTAKPKTTTTVKPKPKTTTTPTT